MRVAYLAAGAGGMYCGNCLRDNLLAATLLDQGRDVVLLPLYTPIRTDERDVSEHRVLYGGISVYLQHVSRIFTHTPRFVDRMLDAPGLLRWVMRTAGDTKSERLLGTLTVSMLEGADGRHAKELEKLIDVLQAVKPDVINLPNLMFVGLARRLKDATGAPVVCTLAGEDGFLLGLAEPYRAQALKLIAERGKDVDGFIAMTDYYARYAANAFNLRADRIDVVPIGVRPSAELAEPPENEVFTIGYFTRICREKGLHLLVDAVAELRRTGRSCRLRVGGYLGRTHRPYLDEVRRRAKTGGLEGAFEYIGETDRAGKIALLRSVDVFCVPSVLPDAKGRPVIEALGEGVPVVEPNAGAYPELVDATGGGILYDPNDPSGLTDALSRIMDDGDLRRRLGAEGRRAILERYTSEIMADRCWSIYERIHAGAAAPRQRR